MAPTLDLVVDDVAAGGDGIARAADGRIVFVAGATPGDRVRARVTEDRPTMLHAEVLDVLAGSADRVAPPCPHVAEGCGGCGWQHVDHAAQLRGKERIVAEALRRLGRLDPDEVPLQHAPPLPVVGFRTSLRLLLSPDGPALRAARSNERVPLDSCLVAHPAIDALVADREVWAGVEPPAADSAGEAPEVTLRVGGATGDRLALLSPTIPAGLSLPDDVTVVGADELAVGRSAWFDDEVAGVRFRIGASSFFQTRTDGAEALVAAVGAAGGDAWGGPVVDAYGGVGLFSCTLATGPVTLIESSASSVADARWNLRERGLDDATVVAGDVARWRPPAGSPRPSLVVADPPRSGLGSDGVDALVSARSPVLILVSCDAAAFARDARLLADAGLRRTSTTLVDLFPHTPHVEVVSRFEARS